MKNKKILSAFFIFIVLFFTWGIFKLFSLKFQRGDIYPPYSSLRSDPLGSKAFYESIKNLIYTERNYLSLKKFEKLNNGNQTFFCLGISIYDFMLNNEEELKSLEKFVKKGGRLIIAFFPLLKYSDSSEKSKKDNKIVDLWDVSINSKLEAFDYKDISKFTLNESVFGYVPINTSLYFSIENTEWKALLSIDEYPIIIENTWEKGSIILCADSYFFSNECLQKYRSTDLFSYMIGYSDKVIFDEFHFGIAQSENVSDFIISSRLYWFIIVLFVIFGLFIWKNSMPLVPLNEEFEKEYLISDKDYGKGLIGLIKQNISQKDLLNICFIEWKKTINLYKKIDPQKLNRIKEIIGKESHKPFNQQNLIKSYNAIYNILKR
ncbi:MAG: DUF4350 domain-containing protein [Desulfobacterales bacterium]|nr:DUF4350 domain-containing protein [Desulfobacterales bacterium]